MDRTIITKEELQAWLTVEIRKFDGCEECSFGGIAPLSEADESGCNWSDSVVIRGTGVPPEIFMRAKAKIMLTARSKFNIRLPVV